MKEDKNYNFYDLEVTDEVPVFVGTIENFVKLGFVGEEFIKQYLEINIEKCIEWIEELNYYIKEITNE